MGLISYYIANQEDFPDIKSSNIFRVPMSDYQVEYYNILREKERKIVVNERITEFISYLFLTYILN